MAKDHATEFYYNERHKQQDADLHEPILSAGDDEKAKAASRKVAKSIGLTDAEIEALLPTKPAK